MTRKLWLMSAALILVPLAGNAAAQEDPKAAPPVQRLYAQQLIDKAKAADPEVKGLAIVATPADGKDNVVVASTFGPKGAPATPEDLSAIGGQTVVSMNAAKHEALVRLPLLDLSQRIVGDLEVVLPATSKTSQADLAAHATQIRDGMARHISHIKNLLEPASMDGKTPTDTYIQHLVDLELAAHPNVVVIGVHATPPGYSKNVIVASNIGRIGKAADDDDMHVVTSGETKTEPDPANGRYEVEEQLKDVGGEVVGAVGVVYNYKPGDDAAPLKTEADEIAAHLARRISHAGNMMDPWPYNAAYNPPMTVGQKLLDAAMDKHPDVIIMAMHITPPHMKKNVIIASNIGRIGKAADEDDTRVIDKGSTNLEVNETGKRFEAEVPQNDAAGHRIGAVGIVFNYKAGGDKEALHKHALEIRDEIAAQTPSAAALAAPAQ